MRCGAVWARAACRLMILPEPYRILRGKPSNLSGFHSFLCRGRFLALHGGQITQDQIIQVGLPIIPARRRPKALGEAAGATSALYLSGKLSGLMFQAMLSDGRSGRI
jgi:hypothetical protein